MTPRQFPPDMTSQDMRLRLVVRRCELPELRLMWYIQLDGNPTIAKLLEQLNQHIPLEGDHWGLEDYVVELHDSDGTDFECLHYQLVRSVLKPDDCVFIRALDRDDHRRRRLNGRDQIASDGRHLIDGVPFGRPHLRASNNRPKIHIPPPKRARLAYEQQNYWGSDRPSGTEPDSPTLLLTNGEQEREVGRSRMTGGRDNAESDSEDSDFTDDGESNSSNDTSHQEEAETDSVVEGDSEEEEGGEEAEEELDQELLDLALDNSPLGAHDPSRQGNISTDALDKLTALKEAFPTAPMDICEKVLASSNDNITRAHEVLCEAFAPRISHDTLMSWESRCKVRPAGPKSLETLISAAPPRGNADEASQRKRKRDTYEQTSAEESAEEDICQSSALQRKYDRTGFPPGTITSGKGLAHMAAISASFGQIEPNGVSQDTSTTLKSLTDPKEDINASSSGSSSDSTSTSGDESDDSSDEPCSDEDLSSSASSTDHEDPVSESSENSDEESESLDHDDGVSHNAPSGEVDISADDRESESEGDSRSGSDSSASDSDCGPEEYSLRASQPSVPQTSRNAQSRSNESSSNESESESTTTDSTSDSDEESDEEPQKAQGLPTKRIAVAPTVPLPRLSSPNPKQMNTNQITVPPGSGKQSTRLRNARRKAAKQAKKDIEATRPAVADVVLVEGQKVSDHETALFEAKRKALLDALATGGIEIGPSGQSSFDHIPIDTTSLKRKSTDEPNNSPILETNEGAVDTLGGLQRENGELTSPTRHRVDMAASRRLILGALGVQKPTSKANENIPHDELRTKVQPTTSQHLDSRSMSTQGDELSIGEKDLDAWKLKIIYRAVECCADGIELTPAPFPFQQRWDPQQQYLRTSKRNKRGGQGKQGQRNQSHYYQDDNRTGKRRKYDQSGGDGYYFGESTTVDETAITLNYDDTETQDCDQNYKATTSISQMTDLDDLPSLPEDISTLPILRPGEAEVGMVITWQKWSCSSATGWQPQLSQVTAIIAAIDDDVALDICLAKRDRHLDGNEKRYDDRTGQRIYDKFEAPDLGDEDEDTSGDLDDNAADEGYRSISWGEMQDPRIVQQPLNTLIYANTTSDPVVPAEAGNSSISIQNELQPNIPAPPGEHILASIDADIEVADIEVALTASENGSTDEIRSSDRLLKEQQQDCSVEPIIQVASNSISQQPGQNQQAIDSTMSDIFQASSPSRQLHETAKQVANGKLPSHNWARFSSVEQAELPHLNNSSFLPLLATVSSSIWLEGESEGDIVSGTPGAALPQPANVSSDISADGSRQPDYVMDDNDHARPLSATDGSDDGSDDDSQGDDNEQQAHQRVRSSSIPAPTRRRRMPKDNVASDKTKTSSLPSAFTTSKLPSSPSSAWFTAVTSNSTQSPSKSQLATKVETYTPRLPGDADDENTICQLEKQFLGVNGDENTIYQLEKQFLGVHGDENTICQLEKQFLGVHGDESSLPVTSSPGIEPDESTQFQPHMDAISPPPRRRKSKRFQLPPGSQLIELSSDSEPIYVENYADDDVDDTYSPKPNRGGWGKKREQHQVKRPVA